MSTIAPAPTNVRSSALYSVYIEGTTVKVRNNSTGAIDYTADNTVNAVTAINSAINNIKNITGATLDSTYGARIQIAAGTYKCTTNLLVSDAGGSASREGIQITGEGAGTVLNFVPGGALTNAITLTGSFSVLEDIQISANANVVNYVQIIAPTPGATDWLGSRGKISRLIFQGTNWGGTYLPTTGQTGIKVDGGTGTPEEFFWRITNCDFESMDTGILCTGTYSTSTFQNNNSFLYCTVGVDIASNQHIVTNMWYQGTSSAGTTGIRLRGTAGYNNIDNVVSELALGTTCQTVLLDSGASHNTITGIQNAAADGSTSFVITDNSASNTNYITYLDNTGVPQVKTNDGSYITGAAAMVGFPGGGAVDVTTKTASSFGFFRVVPTYTTVANNSARAIFRFLNNNPGDTTEEYVQFAANGTDGYSLYPTHAGGGSLRPLILGMNGTAILTIKIDNTADFNSKTVINASLDSTNNFATTATTATTGAQTLPGNPAGFVSIKVGGVAKKIPYYNA